MIYDDYDREWHYRMSERLGMILETSDLKHPQRTPTRADEAQARREVIEDMDELERLEQD